MAMAGVGCRAQSALFVAPAAFSTLLPRARATNCMEGRKYWSSSSTTAALRSLWREGCYRLPSFLVQSKSGKVPHRLFVKAVDVSGPGAVNSPLMQSMQTKIKEDLKAESVSVMDAYGDGRHVSIDVVASAFEGKSAVNRQRMVYKAIWQELQETVHAVDQLKTRTPSEAANSPGQL